MFKKMKVRRMLALSGILCTLMFGAAFPGYAEGDNTFVGSTRINGIDVSGLTVEAAAAKIQDPDAYRLEIVKKDGSAEMILGSEIGYWSVLTGELSSILVEQNAAGRKVGPGAPQEFSAAVITSYDEAALESRIQNLSVLKNEGITATQDARISEYEEGKAFRIIPEVYGDTIIPEHTAQVIRQAVASGQARVDLEAQGCYRTVSVKRDDEGLRELLGTMNRIRDMVITYTFGEKTAEDGSLQPVTEQLQGDVMAAWVRGAENGEILIDRDQAAAYIRDLASRHDTADTTRKFRTVTGQEVSLTGPYGWKMDQTVETDALIGMMRTGESQTREPAYTSKAVSREAEEWGNTYVEIDLTNQHVYMIQEGQPVWDAPCVTGNVSKNYTTPPGLYSLTYKQRDRVLRGKKLPNGKYEYESPVDYWMPFNGGIGLHDANWRSSFGGTIYQTNGSHGCVNLPPASVPALYDMVYTGIPVICYN